MLFLVFVLVLFRVKLAHNSLDSNEFFRGITCSLFVCLFVCFFFFFFFVCFLCFFVFVFTSQGRTLVTKNWIKLGSVHGQYSFLLSYIPDSINH